MALTQAQWFQKLKSFVPAWWFEKGPYTPAAFQAMAAVFQGVDQDSSDHFDAQFITRSTEPTLDALGDERAIERVSGESDASYAPRIQHITSRTEYASIKAEVDAQLLVGECTILEAPFDGPYCSRGSFCSRGSRLFGIRINYFLILIPPQVHAPYSFCSREAFGSRLDFIGSLDSSAANFAAIIAAVDKDKAFGVMYGILESAS